MNRARRIWLLAGAAILAGAAGFGVRRLGQEPAQEAARSLAALALNDLDGQPQSMRQWRGKILVVNFWATWCAPCREEVPGLVRLANSYSREDLDIVGIAIDNVDKVREFAAKFKISYPLVIGGLEVMDLIRELGNASGGLPFTVVLGEDRDVILTHIGKISEQELRGTLVSALKDQGYP